jgi:TfoX/Sxy family transcriptional regulator of competence genes
VVVVLLFTSGLYSNDPIIYGLLSSLAVYVGVTLATAPRRVTTGAQVTA